MQKVKHQCKLHIVTLDYDWRKDNERNFCTETLKTAFLIACLADETKPEKNGLKYLPARIFLVCICKCKAASAISTVWKTHSCKLILNKTRNRNFTLYKFDCPYDCNTNSSYPCNSKIFRNQKKKYRATGKRSIFKK